MSSTSPIAGWSACATSMSPQMHAFLYAEAPRLLFPFARRVLADAVRDAGYTPLMLDPIDFNGLYVQQLQRRQTRRARRSATPDACRPAPADARGPMSLARNAGTVGGLTALSRVFGFLRDMALARLLGAGLAADAFQLAFVLPNTFRRLFAEGAFSVAFVPMYANALEAEDGAAKARDFAGRVLSMFVWVLGGFSVAAMIAMPALVWLLARDFSAVPGKFELTVTLARITFPYLGLVSIVAMLSGLLTAHDRFAPGATVPLLLNLVLLGAIAIGAMLRGDGFADAAIAAVLAVAVAMAGVVQLGFMLRAVRRLGVRLAFARPRWTPEVRSLAWRILPATAGAGIYQASQFVDTFFATSLPQGSLTLLKYADRLEQLPIGVVGMALGTAILPALARHVGRGRRRGRAAAAGRGDRARDAADAARRGGAGDLRASLRNRAVRRRPLHPRRCCGDEPGRHRADPRPSRLRAGEGAAARLLQPRRYHHADGGRGRSAARQHRAQLAGGAAVRARRPCRRNCGDRGDQHRRAR